MYYLTVRIDRMGVRQRAGQVFELLLILIIVSLVAGQVLGQPILLGFVTSGSMAPTIETGDGFIAMPTALAGSIEPGNVIVFSAEQINGGGLVTHRVVRETERGYITRGDANTFPDQAGDEPPVQRAQIVAVAFEFGGSVVVIPHLGTVVRGVGDVLTTLQRTVAASLGVSALLGTQGLAYLILGVTGLLYIVDVFWLSGQRRHRERSRARTSGIDIHTVSVAVAALVVIAATAGMLLPSGATQYGIVSAAFQSEQSNVIPTGESKTQPLTVPNHAGLPVIVFFEPRGEQISVADEELILSPLSSTETQLTVSAPAETGYYRQTLMVHRYFLLLPPSVIRALFTIHPWLPIIAIDGILAGAFYGFTRLAGGKGRLRRRRRRRTGSFITRVRRKIRRFVR